MLLQAVIEGWFGLVNGKRKVTTTFRYVWVSEAVLFLICGARNEQTINQKQNTAASPARSGSELKVKTE
jgi:hypothetical protein